MKTLKFVHGLAEDIRKGIKTTTWRVNDTQDISVNDEVELIDEVDRDDPATWQVIGTATVDKVIEKRLGDVTRDDMQGHETFDSRDDMLRAYRRYAGSEVTFRSPVKIVHFKLIARNDPADRVVNSTPSLLEIKLFADGGSRGNPGPSASGFAIMGMDGKVVVKKGVYLGITTNNQAEYQSLKLGLEEALHMQVREVHVFMDSMLVINQMTGSFKIKNRDLWPIHAEIAELVGKFRQVSFTQVPRELNKLADKVVNETLDGAATHQ
jgi:ribonuclease HI